MGQFSYFFSTDAVRLSLINQEKTAAVEEVVQFLKHDPRVTDWKELFEAMNASSILPWKIDEENGLAIYHARTNAVQDLVMAAGRSLPGIVFENFPQRVRLILVIGIPHALSQEYLRVLGSLARSLKEPTIFQKLLTTDNVDDFITLLAQGYE